MTRRFVDGAAIIDDSPVGAYQLGIFVLCALVAALDGFDTQAIGYTAPLVAGAIKAPMASFGMIFSAGLVGATIGALALGPLADRFGRKWLLVVACLLFALFSLLTVTVTTLHGLLALRVLTGLGLGGATPSFLALGAEYAPRRLRSFAVTALYAAFPFGGFIGGMTASVLIPRYGWQSVFLAGGIAPLAVALVLALWLPESLRFLLAKGADQAVLRRILDRIAPAPIPPEIEIVSGAEDAAQPARLQALFGAGRAGHTVLLWIAFFMTFMVLLTVTAWTPSLLRVAAIPLSAAVLVLAANNLGSVAGNALSGYLVDRYGALRMLVPAFLLGAASLAALGFSAASLPLLTLLAASAGFFVGGASAGLIALAAAVYPTPIRSTGIGWGMGMGRLGQILGPLAIGMLVARHAGVSTIFLAAALPCIVGGLAIALLCLQDRPAEPRVTRTAS
jgi:AAHS family 4-hydroxybenzoate transporter-like MFS transporter